MSQIVYLLCEEGIKVLAELITTNIKKELSIIPQKVIPEDEYFDINGVCKRTKLKKSTIYGHVHHNKIPFIKKGKMLRFSKIDIDKWIEDGKNTPNSDLEAKANEYLAKKPLF